MLNILNWAVEYLPTWIVGEMDDQAFRRSHNKHIPHHLTEIVKTISFMTPVNGEI